MMPDFKTEIEILPGWCSEAKFKDIYETVVSEQPDKIVEIGVFGGRSLLAFGHACADTGCGYVDGIDPYSRTAIQEGGDGAANHDWWTQEQLDKIFEDVQDLIIARNLTGYVRLFRKHSKEAFPLLKSPLIPMLHIDGNHSEIGSCADVSRYLPRIKQNGIIYFDDINWPTTLKAQGMLAEQCDLLRVVDQCAVYRKR